MDDPLVLDLDEITERAAVSEPDFMTFLSLLFEKGKCKCSIEVSMEELMSVGWIRDLADEIAKSTPSLDLPPSPPSVSHSPGESPIETFSQGSDQSASSTSFLFSPGWVGGIDETEKYGWLRALFEKVCVCVCMCIYVSVYIYVCVCLCIYVYIYAYIYVCVLTPPPPSPRRCCAPDPQTRSSSCCTWMGQRETEGLIDRCTIEGVGLIGD
jgi:hypothetical protein